MKKLGFYSLILVTLLFATSLLNPSAAQGEIENVGFFVKSTLRYSNPSEDRVWNFTEREEDRIISLFMNNTWQTVELVNSTFSVEKTTNDDDGNPIAILRFPKPVLQPGENLTFTFRYHAISKPRTIPSITESESDTLTDLPPALKNAYTREEGPWQTSNPTLRQLAFSQRGSETKVLTIVKDFIEWIKEHISYPTERHENPYYPNQTYARKEGDCDDQAMLLITLCRIVGIPSFLQVGCIYLPTHSDSDTFWDGRVSLVQRRIGWHGWAVVYVPPWGWLPVDLTYVPAGFDDPLNAIKHGAVTGQDTIQYMNVTHTDYVASSFESRAFLNQTGFDIYVEDEMTLDVGQPQNVIFEQWLPFIFTAVILVSVFLVATSFLIYRRSTRGKSKGTQTPQIS